MSKPTHHFNAAGTTAVCTASADAECRTRTRCESEGWSFRSGCAEHEGKHKALIGGDCWMVEWINAADLPDTFEDYENPPEIIPGAAIDLEFIGMDEGCVWTYTKGVTP